MPSVSDRGAAAPAMCQKGGNGERGQSRACRWLLYWLIVVLQPALLAAALVLGAAVRVDRDRRVLPESGRVRSMRRPQSLHLLVADHHPLVLPVRVLVLPVRRRVRLAGPLAHLTCPGPLALLAHRVVLSEAGVNLEGRWRSLGGPSLVGAARLTPRHELADETVVVGSVQRLVAHLAEHVGCEHGFGVAALAWGQQGLALRACCAGQLDLLLPLRGLAPRCCALCRDVDAAVAWLHLTGEQSGRHHERLLEGATTVADSTGSHREKRELQ